MSEFDKLIEMLDKSGIPYERDDDNFIMLAFGAPLGGINRIKYPKKEDFECSVIFGNGTYGFESGELEIMGLLTPEEEACDSVAGYLTAEDVFNRISKHYKETKHLEHSGRYPWGTGDNSYK